MKFSVYFVIILILASCSSIALSSNKPTPKQDLTAQMELQIRWYDGQGALKHDMLQTQRSIIISNGHAMDEYSLNLCQKDLLADYLGSLESGPSQECPMNSILGRIEVVAKKSVPLEWKRTFLWCRYQGVAFESFISAIYTCSKNRRS